MMQCSSTFRTFCSVIILLIAFETHSLTSAQTENLFTFILALKDGISGVDGLNDVFASAVSPDGKHLYAVAGGDNSISLFQRNRTTGVLTFVDMWQVDVASESDDHYVVISPDGRHVYVTAERAGSVLVFGRNITSGLLNYIELIDLGSLGFGEVRRIEISPDGENLFTTVGNSSTATTGGLLQFQRNESTGKLTFQYSYLDQPNIYSIKHNIFISPDGRHVYISGSDFRDLGTLIFERESATTALTFLQISYFDDSLRYMASTSDGKYIFGLGDDEVTSFSRNSLTGELEAVDSYQIEPDQYGDWALSTHLVASPSSSHIYVSTSYSRSIYAFEYDPENGNLEFVDLISRSDIPWQHQLALYIPSWLSISPDGAFIHVSNPNGESFGVFNTAASSPVPLEFQINPGLNGSWYYPDTSGQGFLLEVLPDVGQMFLAWFTFDTEFPPEDVQAHLGDAGQRWMVAQGPYYENQAALNIYQSKGGLFDTPSPSPEETEDGSMIVEFSDCNSGTVTYDIPSINASGVIPIQRIALDNVELCKDLQ